MKQSIPITGASDGIGFETARQAAVTNTNGAVIISKTVRILAGLTILFLAGMAPVGARGAGLRMPAATDPETVIATFHVARGKEADFEQMLVREWATYKAAGLVLDRPNIAVRGEEADGSSYFVHVFTWASRATPDHPPASVVAIWQGMTPLVEARGGHPGMEIAPVRLTAPVK